MKVGLIGAENSHATYISQAVNVEKKIKGMTIDYLWGETDADAKRVAKDGHIPNIVKNPKQMLGNVDAVIAVHRHPKHHIKAVWPFVEQGIPAFLDKPFCYRAEHGKKFIAMAKKNKTPITSFSILTRQRSFKKFLNKLPELGDLQAGATFGACELKNKYGNIFFYGIHQVELALKAFGYNVTKVLVTKTRNGNATGQLIYSNGFIVTMNLLKNQRVKFAIGALGTTGNFQTQILKNKVDPFLPGIKEFATMFKTGKEPETYQHMLKPIQVLEALEKSVKSGQIEKVLK